MNRGSLLPAEMLHCADMTVLERQSARLKWEQDQQQVLLLQQQQLQQQQQESFFSELSGVFHGFQMDGGGGGGGLSEVLTTRVVKPDPGFGDNGCPELAGAFGTCGLYGQGSNSSNNDGLGFEMNYAAAISRTSGSPPSVVAPAAAATAVAAPAEVKATESVVSEKMSSGVGRESFKKRKADKALDNTTKVAVQELTKDKKAKGCAENGDSKFTEKKNNSNKNKSSSSSCNTNGNIKNKETSADTSKDNSKVTEVQKPDYIHVRARRGQATDSHSLAERVRREKISERMKYLQDLVPGCNKITGKAGMLDEIINYVQSLQRQVEFLSMKLAAVNPRLDFSIDSLYAKEAFPSCSTSFPTIGTSSDMTNPAFLQFNAIQQQMVTCCGLDMGINPPDMGLRRTITAPVSVPETFLDNSCFTQIQPSSNWDADLQHLYNVAFDQGRTTAFPSHPFTGAVEASNLKMEM